jgi:N-methylhydantoinase A
MDEDDIASGTASEAARELAREASAGLPQPQVRITWDLRYVGQAFELPVQAPVDAGLPLLRELFGRAHSRRYGYAGAGAPIELVNVRVSAVAARRSASLAGVPAAAGTTTHGPAVLPLEEATVVVPPGWSAHTDAQGAVILDRTGGP